MNPIIWEDQNIAQPIALSISNEFITLHEWMLSQIKLKEVISTEYSPEQNCNAIVAYIKTFHWEADEHGEDDELPELESITPVSRNLSPADFSDPQPTMTTMMAMGGPVLAEDVMPNSCEKLGLQLNKHSKLTCKLCGRNFGTKSSYSQHCRMHHLGPRDHRCEVCGKRFHVEWKMKTHQRRHSIRDKPFKCRLCPKQFLYGHDLKRHKAKHRRYGTAGRANNFVCKVCGMKFFGHDLLAVHETRHGRKDGI